MNLVMDVDEKLLLTTTDRGSSESFVGISYLEVNPEFIVE